MHPEPAYSALSDADSSSDELVDQGLSPTEAARRLGISRSRIYRLVELGALESLGSSAARGLGLRVSLASVERRRQAAVAVGQPLSPSSAWGVLALASGDAAFRDHVAARLSDPDRSRARTRLTRHALLDLLPRLRGRGILHRYAVAARALVDVLADARLVLAGPSAARALGWKLPAGSWPVDAYVAEPTLVDVVERYALEPDPAGDLLLRSVPEPWPFPPPLRVVPELVAAVDLADGPALELVELGRARLVELTADLDPLWRRRSRRGASVRPLIPTAAHRATWRAPADVCRTRGHLG